MGYNLQCKEGEIETQRGKAASLRSPSKSGTQDCNQVSSSCIGQPQLTDGPGHVHVDTCGLSREPGPAHICLCTLGHAPTQWPHAHTGTHSPGPQAQRQTHNDTLPHSNTQTTPPPRAHTRPDSHTHLHGRATAHKCTHMTRKLCSPPPAEPQAHGTWPGFVPTLLGHRNPLAEGLERKGVTCVLWLGWDRRGTGTRAAGEGQSWLLAPGPALEAPGEGDKEGPTSSAPTLETSLLPCDPQAFQQPVPMPPLRKLKPEGVSVIVCCISGHPR